MRGGRSPCPAADRAYAFNAGLVVAAKFFFQVALNPRCVCWLECAATRQFVFGKAARRYRHPARAGTWWRRSAGVQVEVLQVLDTVRFDVAAPCFVKPGRAIPSALRTSADAHAIRGVQAGCAPATQPQAERVQLWHETCQWPATPQSRRRAGASSSADCLGNVSQGVLPYQPECRPRVYRPGHAIPAAWQTI